MMSPGLYQIGLREYKYIHIVLQAARLEFKNESTYKADGKRQKPHHQFALLEICDPPLLKLDAHSGLKVKSALTIIFVIFFL